jgi:hypothetical protein
MRTIVPGLACAALIAAAPPAMGQTPRPSQHGSVSQTINTTIVTIEYDRPAARGRQLFGDDGLVVYDALWTPGANRATILELSRPARVAGHDVPAGRYGVWTIPRAGEWTFILSRTWDTSHSIYPGEEADVVRTTVRPEHGAHIETLAFYFPVVGPYNATLHLHWGDVIVPIPIEIER